MIPLLEADALIGLALREDIGDGDITTTSIIRSPVKAAARLIAQQRLVLAGLDIVQRVFEKLDPEVKVRKNHDDGEVVGTGEVILEVEGSAAALLAGERIALNFIQRLSGIATLTVDGRKAGEGRAPRDEVGPARLLQRGVGGDRGHGPGAGRRPASGSGERQPHVRQQGVHGHGRGEPVVEGRLHRARPGCGKRRERPAVVDPVGVPGRLVARLRGEDQASPLDQHLVRRARRRGDGSRWRGVGGGAKITGFTRAHNGPRKGRRHSARERAGSDSAASAK